MSHSAGGTGYQGPRSDSLFELIPLGLLVVNKDRVIVRANSAATALLGYRQDELEGLLSDRLIPERHRPNHVRYCNLFFKSSNRTSREMGSGALLYALRADDREIPVDIMLSKYREGSEDMALCVVKDLSTQETAKRALSDSEQRFREFVERSFDALITIDPNGIIQYQSPAASRIIGFTAEEVIGKSYVDLVPPEELASSQELFAKLLSGDVLETHLSKVKHKDGRSIDIEVNALPIIQEGRIAGIQATYRDITTRLKAEHEQEELRNQLYQTQKMDAIGRLASGIAHDFNNLLTGIIGYTEFILRELSDENPIRDDLIEVQTLGRKAAQLTGRLLSFTRKEGFKPQIVDLNRIVAEMSRLVSRVIGADISVNLSLDENLGRVQADPGQIEQILMNLAVNARDAMPGGGTLTFKTENVTLDEEDCKAILDGRPGTYVRLAVTDTGTGMAQAVRERIFEPFFTTKAEGKGTGLGLSMVYGIVKVHRGWINVYSEPGHGTTFSIYLTALKKRPKTRESLHNLPALPRGRGERVLVVEDEEAVRSMVERVLKSQGLKVITADSIAEALRQFDECSGNVDILFSDVVLPDGSGLALADELGGVNPGLRVLLASGYSDVNTRWADIEKRGISYIQKPYSITGVVKAVLEAKKLSR